MGSGQIRAIHGIQTVAPVSLNMLHPGSHYLDCVLLAGQGQYATLISIPPPFQTCLPFRPPNGSSFIDALDCDVISTRRFPQGVV